MTWYTDYRQGWIAECLQIYGYISRIHVMRKFDISAQQVSNDFRCFMDENPNMMKYDNRKKLYRAVTPPKVPKQALDHEGKSNV